jgi:penicillin-binding protein 1C
VPPPGLVATTVAYADGREAARREWFLSGTEAAAQRGAAAPAGAAFGIRHPRDGSLFAIDPDIPPSAQRITFEGEPARGSSTGSASARRRSCRGRRGRASTG